jgi:hypothetical protein
MMTEEEKEAIEWLERLVKINKRDNLFNTFAEILLNIIQKQSKIIDEILKTWKQDDVRSIEELKKYFEERCK